MNRLHTLQCTSLLLIPAIWEVMCLQRIPGAGMLLGAAGAYLFSLALLLPLLTGAEIFRMKWVRLVFAGYFLLTGARNLAQLSDTAPTELLAVPGRWGAGFLLVLTCLYTAAMGLPAAARSAPVILGVFLLGMLLLAGSAWRQIDVRQLQWDGLPEGMGLFFLSTELPALWVLRGRLEGSAVKTAALITLGKTLVLGGIGFLCVTAGGVLMQHSDAPFFTLCALSQPLQGQRADALYILMFVMFCVMELTLQAGLCAHLLGETFAACRKAAPVVLLLMLGLSAVLSRATLDALCAMLMPVLAFGLPCAILMLRTLRRRSRA